MSRRPQRDCEGCPGLNPLACSYKRPPRVKRRAATHRVVETVERPGRAKMVNRRGGLCTVCVRMSDGGFVYPLVAGTRTTVRVYRFRRDH